MQALPGLSPAEVCRSLHSSGQISCHLSNLFGGERLREADRFRKEYVAVDVEGVAFPGGFEGVFEESVVRDEDGFAAVATEGDEVKMAFFLVSFDHPTSGSSRGPPKDGRVACGSVKDSRWRENGPP